MSDKEMPSQSKKPNEENSELDLSANPGKSDPNRIISLKLKALYNAVEEEGIPDRFLNLLEQLDEAERRNSRTVDGNE